ncbi:hypothetical protein AVEN_203769-1 [Araneus ventricosus]|uniref:Uncharacterized protein n=1 Tax=Araneus ventricosus TaxID=182803 RepID=A0A4Y2IQQ5_ARAVE|nr:hypothetical protein AVEN_203769-1 [Araneus ventricosus]
MLEEFPDKFKRASSLHKANNFRPRHAESYKPVGFRLLGEKTPYKMWQNKVWTPVLQAFPSEQSLESNVGKHFLQQAICLVNILNAFLGSCGSFSFLVCYRLCMDLHSWNTPLDMMADISQQARDCVYHNPWHVLTGRCLSMFVFPRQLCGSILFSQCFRLCGHIP